VAAWTPAEIETLRRVYADDSVASIVLASSTLIPTHSPNVIQCKASLLGFAAERRERLKGKPRVQTIRADVGPRDPSIAALRRKYRGPQRPTMCPNCAHVYVVPADPLLSESRS
jgi:hypothetical protein